MKPYVAFLFLVFLGCDRFLPPHHGASYVPRDAGLMLIYEDPTLVPDARFQERLQRQVVASRETPQGLRVTVAYTTLKGHDTFSFLSRDGGWALLRDDAVVLPILPEGFPDRVERWVDPARGMTFRVLGRAEARLPGLNLPEDADRIGIWVEREARDGTRLRIFFLPGIGEAESLALWNGRWTSINRLVSRSFEEILEGRKAP